MSFRGERIEPKNPVHHITLKRRFFWILRYRSEWQHFSIFIIDWLLYDFLEYIFRSSIIFYFSISFSFDSWDIICYSVFIFSAKKLSLGIKGILDSSISYHLMKSDFLFRCKWSYRPFMGYLKNYTFILWKANLQ